MKYCFNSVRHKLTSRLGLFDIYGLDFMVDENMKVWLIEINCNPSMSVSRDVLKETIPPTLQETIGKAWTVQDIIGKALTAQDTTGKA